MTALQVGTVLACVKIIGNGIASLPLHVFERQIRDGRDAKRKAHDHPLYDLLRNSPNEEMSSHTFRLTLQAHALLWGNAYAEIQRNNAAQPVAIWPRNPARTRPVRLTSGATIEGTFYPAGTLIFHTSETMGDEISAVDDSQNRMAPERIILAEDMLHVPGLSLDGRLGQSTVYLSRQIIGLALATEKYGAKFFGNGAVPRGVLEIPNALEQKALENLRRSWAEAHGGENSNKTAVLEQGVKFTPIATNPEQGQFLEARHFQKAEIASIFNVPLHMVGEKEAAKSSVEQTSIEFLNYCLNPWLDSWEQEYKRKLFGGRNKSFFAKFDVQRLLYPDAESRSKFYQSGKTTGWLNSNDIRELEDMNPIEDGSGDVYWMPTNMQDAAHPITAPHMSGGSFPGVEDPQRPEKPLGGAPQNRMIEIDSPKSEESVGPWTISLYQDDSTWHVLIFGKGLVAHVYHGPDESTAEKIFQRYSRMDKDSITTVMDEHLSGDKDALAAKANRSLISTSLITRYERSFHKLFRDGFGRLWHRLDDSGGIGLDAVKRAFEPSLYAMVTQLCSELRTDDETELNTGDFINEIGDCIDLLRTGIYGVGATSEIREAHVVKALRATIESFACEISCRYNPDHAKQPRHPDGTWHDGKKPFYIGRHARTDDDDAGVWSGHRNVPVNAEGEKEIAGTIEKLRGLGVKRIVTSPLVRAKHTAQRYADALGVPLTTDSRLSALRLGDLEGLSETKDAHRLAPYLKDPNAKLPGSDESVNDYKDRVNNAMDELRGENESSGPILAVSHSSALANYLEKVRGQREDLQHSPELLSPAGVAKLNGRKVTVVAGKISGGDAA